MDTEEPNTFDYIWVKGPGITVKNAQRMGEKASPKDATIYGSDHFSLIADFEIEAIK